MSYWIKQTLSQEPVYSLGLFSESPQQPECFSERQCCLTNKLFTNIHESTNKPNTNSPKPRSLFEMFMNSQRQAQINFIAQNLFVIGLCPLLSTNLNV